MTRRHHRPSPAESTALIRRPDQGLAAPMRELACELAALRQEMRGFRESVGDLKVQVADIRRQAATKDEQVIVLRTQHRILWAVAAVAGTSGLGALVLELLRVIQVAEQT